jgi:hypothetical protein
MKKPPTYLTAVKRIARNYVDGKKEAGGDDIFLQFAALSQTVIVADLYGVQYSKCLDLYSKLVKKFEQA